MSTAETSFFHPDSDAVRFWVLVDGTSIGCSISRATLHYRFRPEGQNEDPLETYRAYAAEIAAAVKRRVEAGALEPVMLREYDLGPRVPAEARR